MFEFIKKVLDPWPHLEESLQKDLDKNLERCGEAANQELLQKALDAGYTRFGKTLYPADSPLLKPCSLCGSAVVGSMCLSCGSAQ